MSDGDQQQTPANLLDGLSFAPDWAKGSSDSHYTHLSKYAARFDADAERRRSDGRDRPFGKRPPRGDRPAGDRKFGDRPPREDRSFGDRPPRREDRPFGDRPPRRDGPRDGAFRRDRPPRREWVERTPPPFSVRFLPQQNALSLIARKISAGRRAMPLREIVGLFFKTPDSILVRLEYDEAHKEDRFHQCQKCEWFSSSEDALRNHLLAVHFTDFFEPREITVEAPGGTFSSVARCGVTGKLLAPPNHHSYNRRIEEMLRTPECAGLSEAEYRSRIEVVRDPEAVEQWRQEATRRTVWVRKPEKPAAAAPQFAAKAPDAPADSSPAESAEPSAEAETPAEAPAPEASVEEAPPTEAPAEEAPATEAPAEPEVTYTREEAEALFLAEIAPKLSRHSRHATASHAGSLALSDATILSEIRRAWALEQRNVIGSLFFAVRGGLKARKLALFRTGGPRRDEFVSHRAPTPLNAPTAVPELKAVLDYVTTHPGCTHAELAAALMPAGTPPETAAAIQKQFDFVLDRGHLIEYSNGVLALPEEHPYFRDTKSGKPPTAESAPEAPAAEPAPEAPAPESAPEAPATEPASEPAPEAPAPESAPEAPEPAPETSAAESAPEPAPEAPAAEPAPETPAAESAPDPAPAPEAPAE